MFKIKKSINQKNLWHLSGTLEQTVMSISLFLSGMWNILSHTHTCMSQCTLNWELKNLFHHTTTHFTIVEPCQGKVPQHLCMWRSCDCTTKCRRMDLWSYRNSTENAQKRHMKHKGKMHCSEVPLSKLSRLIGDLR